jgi:zinc transport system permease protein
MAGVSARALGALPVFALATLPATTVLVLGLPLGWAFAVAALLGAVAGASGYLFAFFFEFPVGGSQTMAASAVLATAFIARKLVGLVRR